MLRALLDVLGGTRAVLERDFLVATSRGRFVFLRTAVLVVLSVVLGAVLIENVHRGVHEIGNALFATVWVVVPACVALLAPALAAPSIVAERELETLDVVLTAPVTATSFVLAKFASRLLAILVLVLATVPVAALSLVYGGFDPAMLLWLYVFIAVYASFAVAVSVMVSAWARRISAAVVRSYLLATVLPAVSPLIVAVVHWLSDVDLPSGRLEALLYATPSGAWFNLGGQTVVGGLRPVVGIWNTAHTVMATLAAAALVLAAFRVSREAAFTRRTAAATGRRRGRRVLLDRPALAAASGGSLFCRRTWRTVVPFGLLVVVWGYVGVAVHTTVGDDDAFWPHLSVAVCITALAVLATLARASGTLVSARRKGSLHLLVAAPVTRDAVVDETWLAAFVHVGPVLALGLVQVVAAATLSDLPWTVAAVWLADSLTYVGLASAIGVRVSVTATTPTRAVLRTFGVFLGSAVAVALIALLLGVLGANDDEVLFTVLGGAPAISMCILPPVLTDLLTSFRPGDADEATMIFGAWTVVHALAIPVLLTSARTKLRFTDL